MRREADTLRAGGPSAAPVKGGNTAIFGIRGGVPDPGNEGHQRARTTRVLKTAWEQLNCSLEIARSAFGELGKGAGADLDEAAYLADEAVNALNGATQGIACTRVSPPGSIGTNPERDKAELKGILEGVVKKVETIENAESAIATLEMVERQQRERGGQTAGRDPDRQNAREDDIVRVLAEQKAFHEKDAKAIEAVGKEQEEEKGALEAALAALRNSQRVINEKNARKRSGFADLKEFETRTAELQQKLTGRSPR